MYLGTASARGAASIAVQTSFTRSLKVAIYFCLISAPFSASDSRSGESKTNIRIILLGVKKNLRLSHTHD